VTVAANRYRWREPGGLGTALRFLLPATGIGTLLVAIAMAVALSDGSLVFEVPAAGERGTVIVPWAETPWLGLTWIPSLLSQVTIVVWLIWHYQVTANLWSRGLPDLRTTPGWAVGWWFIPFAWYVLPFLAVREVDQRSTPDGTTRRMGAILPWWWAAWVGAQLIPLVGILAFALPDIIDWAQTFDENATRVDLAPLLRPFLPWMVVYGALQAIAGVFASEVVGRIERAQRAMAAAAPPLPPRPDLP
jgi:hypothetical protein